MSLLFMYHNSFVLINVTIIVHDVQSNVTFIYYGHGLPHLWFQIIGCCSICLVRVRQSQLNVLRASNERKYSLPQPKTK